MNAVEIILTSIGGSTLLAGALIWLTKSLISERLKNAIKHEYDQKLETHKIQLKADADLSIERLKSELAITAAQRNVQFSKVFERTAEAIAETYARLWAFYDAVGNYTSIVQSGEGNPQSKRREVAEEKYAKFVEYYYPRRLFFQKETIAQIEKCMNEIDHTKRRFTSEVEHKIGKSETAVEWVRAVQTLTNDLPPLLIKLEDEFRIHLGMVQNADRG